MVLITGSAIRIGSCIAESLASDGWTVALHYHTNGSAAEDLAKKILSNGGNAITIKADLSNESQVSNLIPKVTQSLGPISCLINNASTFEYDSVKSSTRTSWDLHMETNLRAPYVLSKSLAESTPSNCQRSIINILDQRVWNLTPHFITYTLSKASLWVLTQTLALALAPDIRVNAIGPGPVLRNARQSESDFEVQYQRTPLGQAVSTQEVANTVRYIIETRSLTGQMLAIDGGQHMGWSIPENSEQNE